ncbi:MAG: DCC1-like thiol-disulfide oxidoreductase family protein [Verrucomicrobiota bacterium]
MFGVKQISRWQFGLFRVLLGAYLAAHFAFLLPYAGELFSSAGTLGDSSLSPLFRILPSPFWLSDSPWMATVVVGLGMIASLAFLLGWRRKVAAILLLYLWASLFCRNPLIANPSLAYVGLMLLLSTLIPNGEALRLRPRREAPWFYPSGVYWTAWLLLAIGYTFSGLIKLQSPSWLDGTALIHLVENPLARPGVFRDFLLSLPNGVLYSMTWICLAGKIVFLPLSIWCRSRCFVWCLMLAMHLGIFLVVDFADLTAAMVLIHLFVLDPAWLPARTDRKRRILFYDGECGLCTNTVKFFLGEDQARVLQYAPLQGTTAKDCLSEELRDSTNLSTVVYLTEDGDQKKKRIRSDAVAHALIDVGGFWKIAGWCLLIVPKFIRELGYKFVAKHRLKFFPQGACKLPSPEEAKQLLG